MPKVFIGIGSNIDREHHVTQAICELKKKFSVLAVSPVYETESEGFSGENFYNLVIAIKTELTPAQLYRQLRMIEAQHGRERTSENQFISRTLDLDQLLYDDLVMNDGRFSLPNADITEYAFVLKPLADIAGEVMHPALHISLAQLWQNFTKKDVNLHQVSLDMSDSET